MNWDGDLYGDVVRVRFLYRLRDERKFSSIEQLKIADCERCGASE